jgi:hypothetical protein
VDCGGLTRIEPQGCSKARAWHAVHVQIGLIVVSTLPHAKGRRSGWSPGLASWWFNDVVCGVVDFHLHAFVSRCLSRTRPPYYARPP